MNLLLENIYSNKTCMFVVQTHNFIGMHRFGTDRIMLDTVNIDERA